MRVFRFMSHGAIHHVANISLSSLVNVLSHLVTSCHMVSPEFQVHARGQSGRVLPPTQMWEDDGCAKLGATSCDFENRQTVEKPQKNRNSPRLSRVASDQEKQIPTGQIFILCIILYYIILYYIIYIHYTYIYIYTYINQRSKRACDHKHYNRTACRAPFLSPATWVERGVDQSHGSVCWSIHQMK